MAMANFKVTYLFGLFFLWMKMSEVYSGCIWQTDEGFRLDCGFKKSGLVRMRNLGGVKSWVGLGLTAGDEEGFDLSHSNLEKAVALKLMQESKKLKRQNEMEESRGVSETTLREYLAAEALALKKKVGINQEDEEDKKLTITVPEFNPMPHIVDSFRKMGAKVEMKVDKLIQAEDDPKLEILIPKVSTTATARTTMTAKLLQRKRKTKSTEPTPAADELTSEEEEIKQAIQQSRNNPNSRRKESSQSQNNRRNSNLNSGERPNDEVFDEQQPINRRESSGHYDNWRHRQYVNKNHLQQQQHSQQQQQPHSKPFHKKGNNYGIGSFIGRYISNPFGGPNGPRPNNSPQKKHKLHRPKFPRPPRPGHDHYYDPHSHGQEQGGLPVPDAQPSNQNQNQVQEKHEKPKIIMNLHFGPDSQVPPIVRVETGPLSAHDGPIRFPVHVQQQKQQENEQQVGTVAERQTSTTTEPSSSPPSSDVPKKKIKPILEKQVVLDALKSLNTEAKKEILGAIVNDDHFPEGTVIRFGTKVNPKPVIPKEVHKAPEYNESKSPELPSNDHSYQEEAIRVGTRPSHNSLPYKDKDEEYHGGIGVGIKSTPESHAYKNDRNRYHAGVVDNRYPQNTYKDSRERPKYPEEHQYPVEKGNHDHRYLEDRNPKYPEIRDKEKDRHSEEKNIRDHRYPEDHKYFEVKDHRYPEAQPALGHRNPEAPPTLGHRNPEARPTLAHRYPEPPSTLAHRYPEAPPTPAYPYKAAPPTPEHQYQEGASDNHHSTEHGYPAVPFTKENRHQDHRFTEPPNAPDHRYHEDYRYNGNYYQYPYPIPTPEVMHIRFDTKPSPNSIPYRDKDYLFKQDGADTRFEHKPTLVLNPSYKYESPHHHTNGTHGHDRHADPKSASKEYLSSEGSEDIRFGAKLNSNSTSLSSTKAKIIKTKSGNFVKISSSEPGNTPGRPAVNVFIMAGGKRTPELSTIPRRITSVSSSGNSKHSKSELNKNSKEKLTAPTLLTPISKSKNSNYEKNPPSKSMESEIGDLNYLGKTKQAGPKLPPTLSPLAITLNELGIVKKLADRSLSKPQLEVVKKLIMLSKQEEELGKLYPETMIGRTLSEAEIEGIKQLMLLDHQEEEIEVYRDRIQSKTSSSDKKSKEKNSSPKYSDYPSTYYVDRAGTYPESRERHHEKFSKEKSSSSNIYWSASPSQRYPDNSKESNHKYSSYSHSQSSGPYSPAASGPQSHVVPLLSPTRRTIDIADEYLQKSSPSPGYPTPPASKRPEYQYSKTHRFTSPEHAAQFGFDKFAPAWIQHDWRFHSKTEETEEAESRQRRVRNSNEEGQHPHPQDEFQERQLRIDDGIPPRQTQIRRNRKEKLAARESLTSPASMVDLSAILGTSY